MKVSEGGGRDDMSPADIDCATCQKMIPSYVQKELDNAPMDRLRTAVAVHIETCANCEAAYYSEFRRQGLRKPLHELQQVGQRASVAGVMDQILAPEQTEETAGWRPMALSYGRAWLDRINGAWRQVEIVFGNLGSTHQMEPIWALAGLQGGEEPQATESAPLFTIEEAHFELRIQVSSESEENLCRLDLAVTLFDRFGDYGGVEITLIYEGEMRVTMTDTLGRAHFALVPRAQLQAMRLLVRLPE